MNLIEIKNKVENFVKDDAWIGEFLLDCYFNPKFSAFALQTIDVLSNPDTNNMQIEKLLLQFKNKAKYYMYKYKKTNNIEDAINAETYWMFIEFTTNNSSLTKNIESQLQIEYGDCYLEKLVALDQKKKAIYYQKNNQFSETEKKYICVKKWQDIQHKFVEDGRLSYLYKEIKKHLKKLLVENTNFDLKFTYYLSLILNKKVAHLEDYAKLYLVHPTFNYNLLVGGKALGLIKLYSLGLPVPKTYFVDGFSNDLLKMLNKTKTYAVRSSADIEDGENNSFAGVFDSVLDVPVDQIENAILKVKNSINSTKTKAYFKYINLNKKPKMHIVIQEYINPKMAGVWMSDKVDITKGILEYICGSGELLVSGLLNPTRIKNPTEAKNHDEKFIYDQILFAQKLLNVPSDIEWCFDGKNFFFLQARYVTTDISTMYQNYDFSDDDWHATPASPGKVVGTPVLLNNTSEFVEPQGDEILLTWFTDPEWVPIMQKYKGVITAVGGFLSHAAIICREMKIPCIVEMDKTKLFMLKNAEQIEIDGSTGLVKILEWRND